MGNNTSSRLGTIAYLAPVYSPAIGGGVVYLDLLAKGLIGAGVCDEFVVFTEAYPGSPKIEFRMGGKLRILRKYPFRAGRDVKLFSSYFQYCWQNLQFLILPIMIARHSVDILMVHGSFLNNPTVLWMVLRIIRLFSPNTKIVADLRDPKLPRRKIPRLRKFDLIISCSENISQPLARYHEVESKVRDIPIMVDVAAVGNDRNERTIARHGLQGVSYVFNGSGLSKEKGVSGLFDVVREIRRRGDDVALVIAGKRRYWEPRFEGGIHEGWFRYLGQVPHDDVLALAAGSLIDVNLSDVDSMPRHSLEALVVGAKVLLPKGVPEFERECPEHVASDISIEDLATQVTRISAGQICQCKYNVKRHTPDKVIQNYVDAFTCIS